MKRCPDCKIEKAASEYGRNATLDDGLAFYCKDCFRRRAREAYRRKQAAAGRVVRERPDLPDGHLRCADCGVVAAESEFHRAPRQASGRSSYCRPCRGRRNEESRLRRLYRLSRQQVEDWRDAQGGRCAICRERPAEHVDHAHDTGQVRGMTCFPCNVTLGHMGDDIAVLARAIAYLRSSPGWDQVQPGVRAPRLAPHIGPQRPAVSGDQVVARLRRAVRPLPPEQLLPG